jgi:eukaryotic-like serine/threonine-protein kinase
MTRTWQELAGVYLAGDYELQQFLGSEPEGAYFETAFGPERRRAVLKLVPDESPAGEEQLARWRKLFELSHPHLMPLLDCGSADASGESFVYAVFEAPDDSLASAVANGPLSEQETRDVLEAALDALRYLHEQQMAHGALDADHVVAVGDSIKLASDTVRPAGEGGATMAADLQDLGALVYQLRTGRTAERGVQPELNGMADPLRSIIVGLLEPDELRRWKISDIDAALHPAPAPEPPPKPVIVPSLPERKAPALELPARDPERRTPATPLLVAAAGAVVVAVVLAATHRSTPEAPPKSAAPAVSQPAPAKAALAKGEPAKPETPKAAPPRPVEPKPSPFNARVPANAAEARQAKPPAARTRGGSASRSNDVWRVVVYTYNQRSAAEHKAQTINQKMPGLNATVFTPRGADKAPFYVALGGRMDRDEAIAVRRKARARGLPRDTFVRNFSN